MILGLSFIPFSIFQTTCIINKENGQKYLIKCVESAISRNLIPFLTEFGGNQDWERLKTDLQPDAVYNGKQIRAYMNLQFIQIETFLLNSTYWNYDLYNTQRR